MSAYLAEEAEGPGLVAALTTVSSKARGPDQRRRPRRRTFREQTRFTHLCDDERL